MKTYLQKKFINCLVKHLFNAIDEEDILQVLPDGNMLFKGKVLDKERQFKLAEDADKFKDSTIWKHLSNDVKYKANERMFNKSRSDADILAGKMTLYVIDIIQRKLDELSKTESR